MTCFALSLLLVGALCSTCAAADPEVTSDDLPRIPPSSPAEALKKFQIREGFEIQLVASEPLVVDPIAMCFDENSRLYVVEMRDYSERRDERLGRIKLLEDTDSDGRMDKATIFAEGLPWPTALIAYKDGLFVGSTPDILYYKDMDGDGRADSKRVVFTGFGSTSPRLNVQQLLNSFNWGLDNRIHGANGGNGGVITSPEHPGRPPLNLRNADFSFDPETLDIRLESGGGQYGLTFDNVGRKFVCSNSSHIRQVMYERHYVRPDMLYPLPPPSIDIAVDGPAAEVFRISPDEPWRVIRTKWRVSGLVPGPIEGGGRPSGYFTGATGVTIYRGDALGEDVVGDAFIADIGSNLVHRKKLVRHGARFKAQRPHDEAKREFLASSDNWFRPTHFANAPDGALYISDIYRETIEHPWSIPPNLKKHLDLNSGNDRGRIYRIVPTGFKQPKIPRLAGADIRDLLDALAHPNGWRRDTAARLLFELKSPQVVQGARKRLQESPAPLAHIHLLSVLAGQKALQAPDILPALKSSDERVREHALRLASSLEASEPLSDQLGRMTSDPEPAVRAQLAWTVSTLSPANKSEILARLLENAKWEWEKHAAFAAASTDPNSVLRELSSGSEAVRARLLELSATSVKTKKPASAPAPAHASPEQTTLPSSRAAVLAKFSPALQLKGDAEKGRRIFEERCASCHRLFGVGIEVGPDLQSVRAAGKDVLLANIIDPNREVPPRYATYSVVTAEGDDYSGILLNEAANGVTLRQANGEDLFLPHSKIQELRANTKSLMPEGLEEGLKPQDMADLLAYILAE